jgi:hypothetical protein
MVLADVFGDRTLETRYVPRCIATIKQSLRRTLVHSVILCRDFALVRVCGEVVVGVLTN